MRYKLLALAILVFNPAFAGVYKCIDSDGKTAYQSKPCSTNESSVEINFKTGEAVDRKTELAKQALDLETQQAQEKAKRDLQEKKQQLLIDAKAEAEKNQLLIRENAGQFTAFAIPPYDPDNLSDLVKRFEERLPDIERLRRLAALKVLASGQCQRVEASELNIKSSRDQLTFLVNCSQGEGIYLNEAELN